MKKEDRMAWQAELAGVRPLKGAAPAPRPRAPPAVVEEKVKARIVEVEVERIVERVVEVEVEKIVERIVEVPVERVVERRVERPGPVRLVALGPLLRERGVHDPGQGPALSALAEADRLAGLLSLDDPRLAAAWLDRHLALCCERCTPPGVAILRVPAARCELCEGSDTQAAAAELREACQRARIKRLLIVGGSPAYRKQIERLFPRGGSLKVELVAGDRARTADEARRDQRTADLVVLWGGTLLDHSVSGLYAEGNVCTVAHRGIGGMMLRLAVKLTDGASARRR